MIRIFIHNLLFTSNKIHRYKYLHAEWSDYFTEPIPTDEHMFSFRSFGFSSKTLSPKVGNNYVLHCCFRDHGTAINFTHRKDNYQLLVEKSSFCNCTAQQHAAIAAFGNVTLAYVCGSHCCAVGNDGFCTISNDKNRTMNNVIMASVSYCKANKYIMAHSYGFINITSVNISYNQAVLESGLACLPSKASDAYDASIGSIVSYCLICNNTHQNTTCIDLADYYNKSLKQKMKYSNIIENKCPYTIKIDGGAEFSNCIIYGNDQPYFLNTSPSIILNDCYVDIPIEGIVQTGSTSSFDNKLTFLECNTNMCFTEITQHIAHYIELKKIVNF